MSAAGAVETTITYLEMTAPPAGPAADPPLNGLAVVRAERPTVSFYRYLYDTVGTPWNWTDRQFMDQEALRRIVQDPAVEVWVLWAGGVPAGYAELDRRPPDEVELAYFGLLPEYIGQGLGRYLLDWAVRRAWSYRPRRLRVTTCTLDHPNALATYQRAGFRIYDRRPARLRLTA